MEAEIIGRRRKWTPEQKAALLAEVEAEGGCVSVVARRHGLSESLLYNWRSSWKAASSLREADPIEFVPLWGLGRGAGSSAAGLSTSGIDRVVTLAMLHSNPRRGRRLDPFADPSGGGAGAPG